MATHREEVDEAFEEVIREKMTDDEFWDWVRSWKDVETIIEEALEWEREDKDELIKDFNKKKK